VYFNIRGERSVIQTSLKEEKCNLHNTISSIHICLKCNELYAK